MPELDHQSYNSLDDETLKSLAKKIEDYAEWVDKNNGIGNGSCLESKYNISQKYPSIKHEKRQWKCSIIVRLFKERKIKKKYKISSKKEASHLCHNTKCVRKDHIIFESGEINKSRLCCKLFFAKNNYRCPHKPLCFKTKPC